MPALNINHVSLSTDDLERSVAFYKEVFGFESIATPNFGYPVAWLSVGGRQQLHLVTRRDEPQQHQHFALTVDDFDRVYRIAAERGILDDEVFGSALNELPNGEAQMYIRDPFGNLIEVDGPSVEGLAAATRAAMKRLADRFPQDPDNRRASLYLSRPEKA